MSSITEKELPGSGGPPSGALGTPVCIIGSRGVPACYGGFETFAEHFARYLAESRVRVCVVGENQGELAESDAAALDGIEIVHTTKQKGLNPILFYIESAWKMPSGFPVVLCLGPGGIFAWPICFFRGTKLVLNLDGLNSRRQKWSWLKQKMFRLLETLAALLPIEKVLDSQALVPEFWVPNSSKARVHVVEYGSVDIAAKGSLAQDEAVLNEWGLAVEDFLLVVARLEPENSIEMIAAAHRRSGTPTPLVVVGNWGSKDFERRVRAEAAENCVFLGAIHNQTRLHALRRTAAVYLHGHQVGGTNPSLVEAMASDRPILAHDNPFNRATLEGGVARFFSDIDDLAESLRRLDDGKVSSSEQNDRTCYEVYRDRYTWEKICTRYVQVLARASSSTKDGDN